jgi:hypothetical protein
MRLLGNEQGEEFNAFSCSRIVEGVYLLARAILTYMVIALLLVIWRNSELCAEDRQDFRFLKEIASIILMIPIVTLVFADLKFFRNLYKVNWNLQNCFVSEKDSRLNCLSGIFVLCFGWNLLKSNQNQISELKRSAISTFDDAFLHSLIHILMTELPQCFLLSLYTTACPTISLLESWIPSFLYCWFILDVALTCCVMPHIIVDDEFDEDAILNSEQMREGGHLFGHPQPILEMFPIREEIEAGFPQQQQQIANIDAPKEISSEDCETEQPGIDSASNRWYNRILNLFGIHKPAQIIDENENEEA